MFKLKRSYIILLIGVGTLVAGSVVLGVNSSVLATDFLTNNLVIKKATISPNDQYTTEITTQSDGPSSILVRGQPYEIDVQASIVDKNGITVWKDRFNGDYISNFEAKRGETYDIIIKNQGTQEVTVDAIVGHVPFLGMDDKSKLANVSGTLAGLGVGIIGIIILIIGGTAFFMERRSHKTMPAEQKSANN